HLCPAAHCLSRRGHGHGALTAAALRTRAQTGAASGIFRLSAGSHGLFLCAGMRVPHQVLGRHGRQSSSDSGHHSRHHASGLFPHGTCRAAHATPDDAEGGDETMMQAIIDSPLLGLGLSAATFALGRWIQKKTGWTIANPLLISAVLSISLLLLLEIPYEA